MDFGTVITDIENLASPDDWKVPFEDYARASLALAGNDAPAARQRILNALQANPESEYLYSRLALTYYMENKPEEALKALEDGLAHLPGSLEIQSLKARLLEEQQRLPEAVSVYEDILTSHPNHLETLTSLAEIYFRTAETRPRAKDLCRHILEIDGRHLQALLILGTLETMDGNMDEAVGYLERALRRRRWEPWRVLNLARVMERNRRIEEATRIYTLLMEYFPDSEEIRKRWEELIVQRSGEEGLISAYNQLIEKNPASEQLYSVYAQFLIRSNLFDKALEVYRQLQLIQPDNLYVKLLSGFENLQQGDVEAARRDFEEYLSSGGEDNSPTPYVQVAMFYSQFGHDDLAEDVVNRACELFEETNPTLSVLKAELLEKKKDFAGAEDIYRRLAEANPSIAAYSAMLGQCYQLQGKMSEALKAYVQAQTIALPSPRYLMDALLIALELGLTDQAEQIAQSVLDHQQDAGSRVRVMLLAATAFDQFGLNDQTEKWAEEALGLAPHNEVARNLMIFADFKRTRRFGVLKEYPDFIKQLKDPQIALSHRLNYARLLMIANNAEEAVTQLNLALKHGADRAGVATQLAPALAQLGRRDEALATVEWIDPEEHPNDYLTTKADVLKRLKDFTAAEQLLLEYYENNTLLLDSYIQLGALYQDMKAWDQAEDVYRRGLRLFPYDFNLLNNFGYMLAVRGIRLDEAEEMIQFARRLNPGAGYILDSLAWVEYQRGHYNKALELLEEAWRRHIPEAEIAEHIADTYRMLNMTDKAREFYEKAIELNPNQDSAREKLRAIE
ncbi:MAG: hypothetical protein Kow0059_02480 [Candidatus Sumerlaeia bacterium]